MVKAVLVFVVMLLQSPEFRARCAAGAAPARGAGAHERRAQAAALRRARSAASARPKYLPLAATIALFVAMVDARRGALRRLLLAPQVFLNLLIDNAFLLIVAVGMTFVILTGGIDLSVGSVIALTTMVLGRAGREARLEPAGW